MGRPPKAPGSVAERPVSLRFTEAGYARLVALLEHEREALRAKGLPGELVEGYTVAALIRQLIEERASAVLVAPVSPPKATAGKGAATGKRPRS